MWQTLRQAARQSAHEIAWAGETKTGRPGAGGETEGGSGGGVLCHDWAFAVSRRTRESVPAPPEGVHQGLRRKNASVQECPGVVGQGLSFSPEFSNVVVLQVGGRATEEDSSGDAGSAGQHALRVAAILNQNRLLAVAHQVGMRQAVTAGGALSQQVLQALAEAHVLVLVVKDDSGGRAPDEEKGAQDMHDAAAEDQGKQPGAYICDWLSGLAGVQPGRGPPAIFGLALDGSAVPVCEEGWGRLRLQWFHKKTPLQTSIAIDQVRSVLGCSHPANRRAAAMRERG